MRDKNGKLLKEGMDYYVDKGMYVWTARYLIDRGYCCGSRCRHCPYTSKKSKHTTK